MSGDTIELDYGDEAVARTLVIVQSPLLALDAGFERRWFASDLQAGLPRLPAQQREQWTPQQLSLDRLQAFSVKKGCYPGQEIVARTHFLGKAKRGIALFEADASVEAGMDVGDGERTVGSIISVVQDQTTLALAVLPLDRSAAPLHAGAAVLRGIPLRDGLVR
nr:hypothetical protein [Pseudoxanthomonas gei]